MANVKIPPPLEKDELLEKMREFDRGFTKLNWTKHSKDQLIERRIRTPHVMYLFRNAHAGYKLKKTEESTRPEEGLYKYTVCGTVYGDRRSEPAQKICVVFIPSNTICAVKIITVYLEK